jgi:hypothetical protein
VISTLLRAPGVWADRPLTRGGLAGKPVHHLGERSA